jgi:hypothetical protein
VYKVDALIHQLGLTKCADTQVNKLFCFSWFGFLFSVFVLLVCLEFSWVSLFWTSFALFFLGSKLCKTLLAC